MAYQFGHPENRQVGTQGKGAMFEGKRCLVTGASSGIGYGLAERLLQRGAAEVWMCSLNPERIKTASEKLDRIYGRVHWAALDVRDMDRLQEFADQMAKGGPIDFLFANAGICYTCAFEKTPRSEFDVIMETNFYGVYHADKAVIGHMLAQGSGTIVNVASMEGFLANGYHAPYVASKHAVMGLTESLRYEYADRDIRFSVVCPGPVASNIWGRDPQGNVNPEIRGPQEVLTELQAADEILAGVEENRNIILVTDTARRAWYTLHEKPESADRWAAKYTQRNRKFLHMPE